MCTGKRCGCQKRTVTYPLDLVPEKNAGIYSGIFEVNLDFSKGAELVDTLFTVINGGSQYTIPDKVQTIEKDIDLEEIEAEKEASEGNS